MTFDSMVDNLDKPLMVWQLMLTELDSSNGVRVCCFECDAFSEPIPDDTPLRETYLAYLDHWERKHSA